MAPLTPLEPSVYLGPPGASGEHRILGRLALTLPALAPLLVIELWAVDPTISWTLPSYSAELSCASAPCPQPLPLVVDSLLDLTLRPQRRVTGPVEARAALVTEDVAAPWPVVLAGSPEGTFRLRARMDTLPMLMPGRADLIFMIGRPPALALLDLRRADSAAGLIVLRLPVQVMPGDASWSGSAGSLRIGR